jgi:hypothetical protein
LLAESIKTFVYMQCWVSYLVNCHPEAGALGRESVVNLVGQEITQHICNGSRADCGVDQSLQHAGEPNTSPRCCLMNSQTFSVRLWGSGWVLSPWHSLDHKRLVPGPGDTPWPLHLIKYQTLPRRKRTWSRSLYLNSSRRPLIRPNLTFSTVLDVLSSGPTRHFHPGFADSF